MTEPSAAEFYRFVQEAKEQRARADALAVALASIREACLEDIGGRHEEIQCAICLSYWPIAGPPEHDSICILAADQPAAAGAELLAAADAMAELLQRLSDSWPAGTWQEAAARVADYRRARAGLRAGEGPGLEGEQA